MANFTVTITDTIQVFGGEPTNNWGTMLWGQNWAFGDNALVVNTGPVIEDSLASTDEILLGFYITIEDDFSLIGDMYSEGLTDMAGWDTDFGGGTNAENRPLTGYTNLSDQVTSYTTATDITTTWSRQ